MRTNKVLPIVSNAGLSSVIKLTPEQAKNIGLVLTEDKRNTGLYIEQHGDLTTHGVWNIPVRYKAICLSVKYNDRNTPDEQKVYGLRTMYNVRTSGHDLEGWVSLGNKKYSAFTSAQLFEINGKLINAAVIHARVRDADTKIPPPIFVNAK